MKIKKYIYLFLIIVLILSMLYINKEGFLLAVDNVSGVTKCQEVYFILDQLYVFTFKWSFTLDSNNTVIKNLKKKFKNLVGRDVTSDDIELYRIDSVDGNLNHKPEWSNSCSKLSASKCDERYNALKNIARAKGDNVRKKKKAEYTAIMGRNPTDFDVEKRDTYRYVGCLKP